MEAQKVDISRYDNLIAWQARIAYNRLPHQTRNWVSIDDLIQEGKIAADALLTERYDPTKASFSTYLTNMLKSLYLNITDKYFTQKRVQAKDISIDGLQQHCYMKFGLLNKASVAWDEIQASFGETETPNCEEYKLACSKFLLLYSNASRSLRENLARWFFTPAAVVTKHHTKGQKFKNAREEFLVLSKKYGFGPTEFSLLMKYAPEYLDIPNWVYENRNCSADNRTIETQTH